MIFLRHSKVHKVIFNVHIIIIISIILLLLLLLLLLLKWGVNMLWLFMSWMLAITFVLLRLYTAWNVFSCSDEENVLILR